MIDTDKYEGHTEGPWSVEYPMLTPSEPNRKLIDDAPLLLAEVERLRSTIEILAADYDSLILDLGRASTLDLDIEEVYEKHLMGVNDE